MSLARITALHRFPVKGLSPERLDGADLEKGRYFPGDRMFALANGPSVFDPAAPQFRPKTKFLTLMTHPRLAAFQTRYDAARKTLRVEQDGVLQVEGNLAEAAGRERIAAFFAEACKDDLKGRVVVEEAPDRPDAPFRFTDSRRSGFVSLLNEATVADLAAGLGQPVEPQRFRANILVTGWNAWAEAGWERRILTIGAVRLRVLKPIVRCLAVTVNPVEGRRDLDLLGAIRQRTGAQDCGIYAEVLGGGPIAVGDRVETA